MASYSVPGATTRLHSILGSSQPGKRFLGFVPENDQEADSDNSALDQLQVIKAVFSDAQTVRHQTGHEEYFLQRLERGSCHMLQADHRYEQPVGSVVVINPDSVLELGYGADTEVLLFRLASSLVTDVAAEIGYCNHLDTILFSPGFLTHQDDASLHHLLYAIAMENCRDEFNPACTYYGRLLCLTLLRNLSGQLKSRNPHLQSHPHSRHAHAPATNSRIQTVRSHVLRHIKDDMDIEALAVLCGVSVKTLYNLFNREYGKTPSVYIREMKLEAVHQQLANDPQIHNVTQIALDYGFTNLGRFSGQYKNLFGESPSVTLKRTKSQSMRRPSLSGSLSTSAFAAS